MKNLKTSYLSPLQKVIAPLNPPEYSGQALKGAFPKIDHIKEYPLQGDRGYDNEKLKFILSEADLYLMIEK